MIHSISVLFIFFTGLILKSSESLLESGPVFLAIPPKRFSFLNTIGGIIDCSGHGYPEPMVTWVRGKEEIPIRNSKFLEVHYNGSLVFHPFSSGEYIHEIHSNIYKCLISNNHGTIISPQITISAVMKQNVVLGRVYDEYVIRGNTASLKCNVPSYSNDNIRVIGWLKYDENISFENDKYLITEEGHLLVFKIDENDSKAVFKCKIQNTLTKVETVSHTGGSLHITDTSSSMPASIIEWNTRIIAEEGDKLTIPCIAQGHPAPKYRWTKKNEGLNKKMYFDGLNGLLKFEDITAKDGGSYECTAFNEIGTNRKSFNLIVRKNLQAYILPEKQTIEIGKELEIDCTVTGSPIKDIYWYHNGKKLAISRRKLKIKKTNETSIGCYQCFASNIFQTVQASTTIFPGNIKPRISSSFQTTILNQRSNLEVSCEAIGKPVPFIEWMRDDQNLPTMDNINIYNEVVERQKVISTLKILKVKVEDGGKYTCIAKNEVGNDSYSENLQVYGQPIVRNLKNFTIPSGSNITISCFVSGYPVHSIFWTKGKKNEVNKIFGKDLIINNAKISQHQGRYYCSASTKSGYVDTKSTWVKIIVPPKINSGSFKRESPIGESLTLMCFVKKGDRPIDIKWFKNGKKIPLQDGISISRTSKNSLLQIDNMQINHEGNYTCIAKNAAGEDRRTTEIVVKSAPIIVNTQKEFWVKKGDDFNFTCNAVGRPKPTIQWTRFKTGLIQSTRVFFTQNGSLTIKDIQKSDEGRYRCKASNNIEPSTYMEFNIYIGDLPNIATEIKEIGKMKHKLICIVQSPKPFSLNIIHENGSLITTKKEHGMRSAMTFIGEIYSATLIKAMGKSYKCVAKNKFGSFVKEVTISKDAKAISKSTNLNSPFEKSFLEQNFSIVNEISQLNEAPNLHIETTTEISDKKVMASTRNNNNKNKVTFLQILVASVTTAIIILLFVLLLVLIVLWKRRSDRRDEEKHKQLEDELMSIRSNAQNYDESTIERRYGQVKPNYYRSSETSSEAGYYSSITPYATFSPANKEQNEDNIELRHTLPRGVSIGDKSNI